MINLSGPGLEAWGINMWEQLTRTDIERAKQKLLELRAITLRRHEEELKQLEADEAELETLERVAAATTAKYLNGGRTPSETTAAPEESPVPAALNEQPSRPEAQPEPHVQVQQSVSPNFGIPLQKFVRR